MAPVRALFLDCDDCLYQNMWRTERRITDSIGAYLLTLGINPDRALSLYKQYGTTLKGLLVEGELTSAGAEAFLTAAHEIDYCDIAADPQLDELLSRLRLRTWVFTAGTREHAKRCMDAVGLQSLKLQDIIDVRSCQFESKHSASSFEVAFAAARAADPTLKPEECCLCDDSQRNIERAKSMGWTTVLVGPDRGAQGSEQAQRVCSAADFIVPSLHVLPSVLPDLFSKKPHEQPEPASPVVCATEKLASTPRSRSGVKRALEHGEVECDGAQQDGVMVSRRESVEL